MDCVKKHIWLIFLLLPIAFLRGQDTAFDWTRTECGSNKTHHLYAELDSGYVVVIDLVMMNCLPCVTATDGLKAILDQFEADYPGRVRLYSVGFHNSISCEQLLAWKIFNGFKHPAFSGGGDETAYYGGMGMPTIIVAGGGTAHKLYYHDFGYDPAYDVPIAAAIAQALEESHATAVPGLLSSPSRMILSPNPAGESIRLDLTEYPGDAIIIRDVLGRTWYHQAIKASECNNQLTIPVNSWPSGIFQVSLYRQGRLIGTGSVVKS